MAGSSVRCSSIQKVDFHPLERLILREPGETDETAADLTATLVGDRL
jgi:hypothetical protein